MQKSLAVKPKIPMIPVTTPGYYSVSNVMAITGWSRQTIYNRINAGLFPKPFKLEKSNRIYWSTATIQQALRL